MVINKLQHIVFASKKCETHRKICAGRSNRDCYKVKKTNLAVGKSRAAVVRYGAEVLT